MKHSRIEKEKQTVEQMIRLYCRKKEGTEHCARNAGNCWSMRRHGFHVVRSETGNQLAGFVPCIAISRK